MGEYASADCTGELEYTGWEFAQAFGVEISMTINDDGTGSATTTMFDVPVSVLFTWQDLNGMLCFTETGGVEVCNSYDLSGSSMSVTTTDDAHCEDDDDNETEHTEEDCAGEHFIPG